MSRLNSSHKEVLLKFAEEQTLKFFPMTEINAEEKELAKMVVAEVKARYPEKDMVILEKYRLAKVNQVFYVRSSKSTGDKYPLKLPTGLLIPTNEYTADDVYIPVDHPAHGTYTKLLKLTRDREFGIKEKMKNYQALMASATSFKQVVEIWPEAKVFEDRFGHRNTALAVLNDDIITQIHKDVVARKKMGGK